nr:lipase family protein [Actinomadura rayongensis]
MKALTTVAVLAAATLIGVPAAPASADDAFYTPPAPLPAGSPGDIIKSQPSRYDNSTATRIMYLSRDAKDQPIPVTGTVFVPTKAWGGPGPRPVVAYAPFTAGMGDQCAPSKTLAGEGQNDIVAIFQKGYIDRLLDKGIAVAQTDYEGLGTPGDHPYVMRLSEAHTVLDVLRAAKRLPAAGLPADGPAGIVGYSEGGGASASAAELASTYAPELNIKGAYAGAPPADKAKLAKSLDGSLYAAFAGYSLIGIQTSYPEADIPGLANDQGKKLFEEAAKTCTLDGMLKYMFMQTKSLTRDGRPIADYLDQAPFDKIVAENRIGTLKPAMPVEIQHSPFDDVIPQEIGKQLAKDWCAKGANVTFDGALIASPVFAHITGAVTAPATAAAWMNDRFQDKPVTGNCGSF